MNVLDFMDKMNLDDDKKDIPGIEIEDRELTFNLDKDLDINDDYKYSREKIVYMIEACEAVLKHTVKELPQNFKPSAVEAFSSLVKTMNESCERLVSLHEKIKKITPQPPKESKDEEGKPKTVRATVNEIIDGMS